MRRMVAPGVWEEMGPGAAIGGRKPQAIAATALTIGHMEAGASPSHVSKGALGPRLGIKPKRG